MTVADASVVLEWENNPENWEVSDTKEPFTAQEIDDFVRLPQDINSQQQLRLMICESKMGKQSDFGGYFGLCHQLHVATW